MSRSIPTNLRLPSLEENRLEGYAYLFRIVLPLFNSEGKRVYTDPILIELFDALDDRFGGCMVAASSSAPPLWGLWHPRGFVNTQLLPPWWPVRFSSLPCTANGRLQVAEYFIGVWPGH
jgi:hypothetical protein